VLISYLSLVLGELIPKSIALRRAEPYALLMAPLLVWLSTIARPIVWLLTISSNVVLKRFGDSTTFAESRLSPDELRQLVEDAAETGSLDPRLGDIAARAIDFARLTAEHVMIPRLRVVGIPRDATAEQLRAIVLEHAHSRLPVYEGELDNIVGYVMYKDLLPLAWEGRLFVLEDLIRPPFVVVESAPASDLLQQMRERRTQLAVVIDEQGAASGIVTFDDLVEELVGEVFGELHRAIPESIHPTADGSVVVDADVPIRDLNRKLDLDLPEGDGWSTVGGLCMYLAGAIPRQGDVLRAPNGTELHIERASERAVERVRVVPPAGG
jgi:putative hemolysin